MRINEFIIKGKEVWQQFKPAILFVLTFIVIYGGSTLIYSAYLERSNNEVCTAALHLALILLGAGPCEVVICQSFTFSASANPIVYQGATPIFVDLEADTWNMNTELLRDRLAKGKKVKATVPVHLYGVPAKMDAMTASAAEFNIHHASSINHEPGFTYAALSCLLFSV